MRLKVLSVCFFLLAASLIGVGPAAGQQDDEQGGPAPGQRPAQISADEQASANPDATNVDAATTTTDTDTDTDTDTVTVTAALVPARPVAPFFVDNGRISLSVNALGTRSPSGLIEVEKPAGGTVRSAFLFAASTGFTGYEPVDGDVVVEGSPVDFDESRTMINGIGSVNVWADVTSIVKPGLDLSSPGITTVSVAEGVGEANIDGVILAVIFNDPTATIDRTVILAYGAQQVTGDSIELARLPDGALEDVTATLSVGISFGFQSDPDDIQDSTISVNGVRLTSSAGGEDDGESSNGALITVGGIGDSPANPPDPFARGNAPGCPRCDDELYDLTPFVTSDPITRLVLTTRNPSADDNFMFAALDVSGARATWTPAPSGCGELDLVTCYAPEVRFHPDENYFPWDPDLFVLGSALQFSQTGACFQDSLVTEQLTPVDIANENYSAATLSVNPSIGGSLWPPGIDVDVCGPDDREYQLKEFTRPFDADSASLASARAEGLGLRNGFFLKFTEGDQAIRGYTPLGDRVTAPIYAQILPDERGVGESVISYLMFYGFDPKAQASLGFDLSDLISIGDQVIAHQGDWERMDVVLGTDDEPLEVRWFAHGCTGPTFDSTHIRSWDDLVAGLGDGGGLVDGTHPIIYVAEGSHASYPTQHQAGPRVCPEAEGGVLKGTTDSAIFVAGDSARWRPWLDPGSVVDPRGECWYGFGGSWGETGGWLQTLIAVISDNSFNAVKDATGPAGPYHNLTLAGSVPPPSQCGASILVSYSPDTDLSWNGGGQVTLTQAEPNRRYVLTVASFETIIAGATTDAAGELVIDYTIPEGTPPGNHQLVVRDAVTGERVGVKTIEVTPPEECVVTPEIVPDLIAGSGGFADVDGDFVLDRCDRNLSDGLVADFDGDGVSNYEDNCPHVANPDQAVNLDRISGSACDGRDGFNLVAVLEDPCRAVTATIVGTDGDDVLVGTDGDDVIVGLGGNDDIDGLGGDDIICVSSGLNTVRGGDGDDRLIGGSDADQLLGGDGDDELLGNGGDDLLRGGRGADVLDGGEGVDDLRGATGNDVLRGGPGNDVAFGDGGRDQLDGGADDDRLFGGDQSDIITGGIGNDVLSGGSGNDQLAGEAGDDDLRGGAGADSHSGGDDFDRCVGGGAGLSDTQDGSCEDVVAIPQ